MTFPSTGARSRPILDETGFQQLLAAAYILQQHNDSLRAKDPRLDPAWIFSQIAETESLVREGSREVASAAKLIADRLCSMSDAASVSICLIKDGSPRCIASAGASAKIPGGSIASKSPAAAERLKNGRQFQSLDAQVDVRLDAELCRGLGIRSLLAIPIQQAGEIAGLIEIRWRGLDALHECDVRTCQLMAGLLTELLERESESGERATAALMDLTIGKMTAPDEVTADRSSSDGFFSAKDEVSSERALKAGSEDLAVCCRVCGRPFRTDETFCGNCSMPRVAASDPGDGLQSKWASMWFMQQAQDTLQERREGKALAPIQAEAQAEVASSGPPPSREMRRPLFTPARTQLETPVRRSVMKDPVLPDRGIHEPEPNPEPRAESLPRNPHVKLGKWLRNFSQSVHPFALRLRIGRRARMLAVGALGLALILTIWSAWPSQSSSQLTWFESLLVELGLAEVPPRTAPVYAGNSDVRVWEDVHTALYYCPGSDLYGKTPGGRFGTQRSAQEDQFEPATRVACK